jgi:hypothetical protein
MKFQGALIKEQGATFAIVIVKKHVLDNRTEADYARRSFGPYFPGVPVVLMAQDTRGIPSYYGDPNIVKFLASVSIQRIPWKEYTVS